MQEFIGRVVAAYKAEQYEDVVNQFELLEPHLSGPIQALLLIAGQAYARLGRHERAADCYCAASLADEPPKAELLELAFALYQKAQVHEKGVAAAGKLLAIKPDHETAAQYYRYQLHYLLMLDELEAANRRTLEGIELGDRQVLKRELLLNHIAWCGDERINAKVPPPSNVMPFDVALREARRNRPHDFHTPLRVGYLSADFSSYHATMILLRGIFDCHDKSRFETWLFCHTPQAMIANDDGFRAEYTDRIVPIGDLPDDEAAALIRSFDLDILVDLKGHTNGARLNLINKGLAPLQVGWLGFPGSAVGIDLDYIIGDHVVTPDVSKPYFHEKFCRLPESYQCNDAFHRQLPERRSRRDLGLPEDKFVFASFNTIRKLSPENFRAWAAILKAVPDSVLWAMCPAGVQEKNLRYYFEREGVGADRVLIAPGVSYSDHLARIPAADLGLDTFPCNGHTTTSDQLWAGLPVISLKGGSFSSRVSESLLNALGVPELVADDVAGYIKLAAELAVEPEKLAEIRNRILANRFSAPLFDTERFTRHLEAGYEMMVERARAGLEPDHLDVPALPPRGKPFRHQ